MTVVTRFPPSPTGFMHIGNARTAIYNWLFARHHGGRFLVRIEDTDRARHSDEAVQAIFNGLKWLDLNFDNEPVFQSAQCARHAEVANELLRRGMAYHCYCSPEELEQMREQAKKEGRSSFYDRRWRDRSPDEAPEGIKPVVRIKAPVAEGESVVNDLVQGEVRVKHENLDDFIILRSDGTPTYLLSVVVDDHDMGVTHVIRGDDHLNNTFRQKLIYEAMGWDLPYFAHLPMILGQDGAKLSKRHGAVSLDDFEARGYLPEAVLNYLLRLGWSHGDDEIISRKQAMEWFTLDHVVKSAARFDYDKLESLNAHYIKQAGDERLVELLGRFLHERHKLAVDQIAHKRLLAGMPELKDRAKTLVQMADEGAFYAREIPYDFDDKALQTLDDNALGTLDLLAGRFKTLAPFTADNIQQACKDIAAQQYQGKLGKVAMPLRAALTGTTVSPSIFHAAEILGQHETLARLSYVLEKFARLKAAKSAPAN